VGTLPPPVETVSREKVTLSQDHPFQLLPWLPLKKHLCTSPLPPLVLQWKGGFPLEASAIALATTRLKTFVAMLARSRISLEILDSVKGQLK
jgi:hypothetical protein